MYRHGPQRKHTYKQTVSCALLQFFDFRCAAKQQPTNQTRLQNRLLSSEYSLYFVCIVQGCSQSNDGNIPHHHQHHNNNSSSSNNNNNNYYYYYYYY